MLGRWIGRKKTELAKPVTQGYGSKANGQTVLCSIHGRVGEDPNSAKAQCLAVIRKREDFFATRKPSSA